MIDFQNELLANCVLTGSPRADAAVIVDGRFLTSGIRALLSIANGLVTRDRAFRVFGTDPLPGIPSLSQWNESDWKKAYESLANDLIFVAEDAFGDQYGYRFLPNGSEFIKFCCEGGKTMVVEQGINQLIESLIDPARGNLIDLDLFAGAKAKGLVVGENQHLAFHIPLIVGGQYAISNLTIESTDLHLGTLAQLSVKNLEVLAGTKIDKFV
jgi:hypothetical protein